MTNSLLLQKNNWINAECISLKKFGNVTSKEAVDFVIKHKLNAANFLEFPDFDEADLERLGEHCPHLKKLSIKSDKFSRSFKLTMAILLKLGKGIEKFTMLQSLELHADIASSCIEAIGKLSLLQSLSLSRCWSFSGLAGLIEKLPLLKCLKFTRDDVNGQIPSDKDLWSAITKLSKLVILNLSGYCISDDELLEWSESKNFPLLQSLTLGGYPSSDILAKVIENHPLLLNLNLRNCLELSGDNLVNAIGKCSFTCVMKAIGNLTELESLSLDKIGLFDLRKLLPKLPLLQNLCIGHGDGLWQKNYDNDQKIEGGFPSLQHLDLGWSNLYVQNVLKIIEDFPSLKSLDISGCQETGRPGSHDLVKIVKKLPNLHTLISRSVGEKIAGEEKKFKIHGDHATILKACKDAVPQ